MHGIFHLIEHIAMHGLDDPNLESNASVGLWSTDFKVSGEADDVAAFLTKVCVWLSERELSPLAHEVQVLKAEAAQRATSDMATHLDYRYGPKGVGLPAYPELGLHTVTPQILHAAISRFFTRNNAALALNCAPPPGLRLPLPGGERHAIPTTEMSGLAYPAHVRGSTRFFSASGFLHESIASPVTSAVIERTVGATLRSQGLSYGTATSIERVSEGGLLLCISADVTPDRWGDGVTLLHDAIAELAADGPDATLVEAVRNRHLRALSDDPLRVWQAFNSASATLRGGLAITHEELDEALRELDQGAIGEEIKRFAAILLIASPQGNESNAAIPFAEGIASPSPRGNGTAFRPSAWGDESRLVLSPYTISVSSKTTNLTRDLDTAAALLRYPDGARTVIAADGGIAHLEPNLWRKGPSAANLLDRAVPSSVHVDMDPRDPSSIPNRLTAPTRFLQSTLGNGIYVIALAFFAFCAVMSVRDGEYTATAVFVAFCTLAVAGIVRQLIKLTRG